MTADHRAFAERIDAEAVALHKAAPETMTAFRGLMRAAGKDGALDGKTKELMALGIAIAVRCQGCISFHVRQAIRKGATRAELLETIAVAIEMGGGPSTVYGAEALAAWNARA